MLLVSREEQKQRFLKRIDTPASWGQQEAHKPWPSMVCYSAGRYGEGLDHGKRGASGATIRHAGSWERMPVLTRVVCARDGVRCRSGMERRLVRLVAWSRPSPEALHTALWPSEF